MSHERETADERHASRPEGEVRQLRLDAPAALAHPKLPLVLVSPALAAGDPKEMEKALRKALRENGWCGAWTGGVFDYHHLHSNAHELLVVLSGSARIAFGGVDGRSVDLGPGDMAVLPAGTGHRNERSDEDFRVLGAYPCGQEPDLVRVDRLEQVDDEARRRIRAVPLPPADPLFGEGGPLEEAWGRRA